MFSRKPPPAVTSQSYPGGLAAELARRSKGPSASSPTLAVLWWTLRVRLQPLFRVFYTHRVPLVVWLLVGLQCSWMLADQVFFTGRLPNYRPPRVYLPPNESSPLSPFYGPTYTETEAGEIPTKAFPEFGRPFPCGDGMMPEDFKARSFVSTGFFYIHQKLVASTTLAGIAARISRNAALTRRPFPPRNATTTTKNDAAVLQWAPFDQAAPLAAAQVPFNGTKAVCTTRLAPLRGPKRFLQNRIREESFLWTFVREPVQRVLSKYYHWDVSLQGAAPASLDNLQYFIERNRPGREIYGNYFQVLTPRRHLNPHKVEFFQKYTQEILDAVDFIGIQERFDESLAVFQLLLGLQTEDMLYISSRRPASQHTNLAPRTGATYERFNQKCVALQASKATLTIKEYLHQPEVFDHLFEADVFFYRAANASLDRTIEALGTRLVEQTVRRLEWAQAAVAERCLPKTRFPCSDTGEVQEANDCLFSDVACGYACLDALGEELKKLPTGATFSHL